MRPIFQGRARTCDFLTRTIFLLAIAYDFGAFNSRFSVDVYVSGTVPFCEIDYFPSGVTNVMISFFMSQKHYKLVYYQRFWPPLSWTILKYILPFVTCVGKTRSDWNPVNNSQVFEGHQLCLMDHLPASASWHQKFILLQLMLAKHWTVFKFPWDENLSKDRSGLIIHLASKLDMCFQGSYLKSIFYSLLLTCCE